MKVYPSRMDWPNAPRYKGDGSELSKIKELPKGIHPLVYQILLWVRDERVSMNNACTRAGIDTEILATARRTGRMPTVSSLEALGNVFGYTLGWVPLEEATPEPSPKLRQSPPEGRPIVVPETGHWMTRWVAYKIRELNVTLESVAEAAGISKETLRGWRNRNVDPTVSNLDAVLDTLGYELVLAPKKRGEDAGRSGGVARGVEGSREGQPDAGGGAKRAQVA